jgi:CBS domain-containing protein
MQAADLMTKDVICARADTPIHDIARLLVAHHISALPVIDEAGAPIGMVSEGDLIGRSDADREARRDWWLTLLAEGQELNADFLSSMRQPTQAARNVMTAPVVTVSETTEAPEIARLLAAHHIKRVPVLRDGRVVGIVSRADLVRALAAEQPAHEATAHRPGGLIAGALTALDEHFLAPHREEAAPRAAAEKLSVSAEDFQTLVSGYERQKVARDAETARAQAAQRSAQIKSLIDQHIDDVGWREILHAARETAERGEKEYLLLRFPSDLCSDGGRAVNAPLPDWPASLRGEAAEMYLRWERDLKPRGFHLVARVLDFPGGKPGDIGLFLVWSV